MPKLDASHRPIDSTAGKVLSPGFQYVSDKKITCAHWKEKPVTRMPDPSGKRVLDQIMGVKFGRFTICGYMGSGKRGAKYLVRCSCGCYETRTMKAMRNPKNTNDCCSECRHVEHLRRTDAWLRTGTNKDEE